MDYKNLKDHLGEMKPDWTLGPALGAVLVVLAAVFVKVMAMSIILRTGYEHVLSNSLTFVTGASLYSIVLIGKSRPPLTCHVRCFYSSMVKIICLDIVVTLAIVALAKYL